MHVTMLCARGTLKLRVLRQMIQADRNARIDCFVAVDGVCVCCG